MARLHCSCSWKSRRTRSNPGHDRIIALKFGVGLTYSSLIGGDQCGDNLEALRCTPRIVGDGDNSMRFNVGELAMVTAENGIVKKGLSNLEKRRFREASSDSPSNCPLDGPDADLR